MKKSGPKPPPAHTTLRDFSDLKRALVQATKDAAAQAEQDRLERAKLDTAQKSKDADIALFKQTVGKVVPYPQAATRVDLSPPRPLPVPAQSQADEQSALKESLSDDFDAERLLETDESLSWRRPELGLDVVRKLRRGVWALQGELDLHGMRTDEARDGLSHFLREAQGKGWRCLRVVHGKGLGSPGRQPVLKDKVRRWLMQSERVLAFVQARADEGGNGAIVVLLQPGKSSGQGGGTDTA